MKKNEYTPGDFYFSGTGNSLKQEELFLWASIDWDLDGFVMKENLQFYGVELYDCVQYPPVADR